MEPIPDTANVVKNLILDALWTLTIREVSKGEHTITLLKEHNNKITLNDSVQYPLTLIILRLK